MFNGCQWVPVTTPAHAVPASASAGMPGASGASVTLPPPTRILNAPMPRPPAGGSQSLVDGIAACDHTLCSLMAQPWTERRAGNDAHAVSLIQAQALPRRRLAERTADSLAQWQNPAAPPFSLKPEELQTRILHAGLTRIIRHLPLKDLSHAQRLRIGEVLHEAGGRAATLRAWLGLDEADLHGNRAAMLLDLMLTEEQSSTLDLRRRRSTCASNQRALLWQKVDRVNAQFGYTIERPAWAYMVTKRQCPRVAKLQRLAGQPEARRQGIRIALPWKGEQVP